MQFIELKKKINKNEYHNNKMIIKLMIKGLPHIKKITRVFFNARSRVVHV